MDLEGVVERFLFGVNWLEVGDSTECKWMLSSTNMLGSTYPSKSALSARASIVASVFPFSIDGGLVEDRPNRKEEARAGLRYVSSHVHMRVHHLRCNTCRLLYQCDRIASPATITVGDYKDIARHVRDHSRHALYHDGHCRPASWQVKTRQHLS